MSQLIVNVRKTMKSLINSTKNLKTSRESDIFEEIAFNFSKQSINFGTNQRYQANITVQYLVSPNPTNGSTAPSLTYDEIITVFDEQKGKTFRDNNLVLIGYSYEQGDIVTDPATGSVSLAFTINIIVTEKQ